MDGVPQYMLRVIAVSILAGTICFLIGNTSIVGKTIKTIGSLFLTVTLLSPLIHFDPADFLSMLYTESSNVNDIIDDGKKAASQAYDELIIERTQTYILDEASALGAKVDVIVSLDDEETHIPKTVVIEGEISPYAKARLSSWISEKIDIPRENQIWN